jgi:hypothetical protein
MKNTWIALAAIILIISASPACKTQADTTDSYKNVLTAFQNPPSEYGSVPFWVWNDSVTETRIEEQLRDFHDKGIGGVFIHPRPGLVTPYLSEEWLKLCNHAVRTAGILGMKIWIYDENSYPSGFAGGHVPDQMPDSARKSLVMKKADTLPDTFEQEPFLVLKGTPAGFEDITSRIEDTNGTGEYYIFDFAEQPPSPWYGGFTYVDIMRKDVTEKFLAVTLDAYKNTFGGEFGDTVQGSFQDEAHIAPVTGGALSFTPALFETFESIQGYDLKLSLPSLVEETGDWRRVRHDYYAVLNHLIIEGWAKPYSEYCEANNLQFTGHYWEHDWPRPRLVQDTMAVDSYSHMPGIDVLMNQWSTAPNAQFGNARAVKEIRSTANQMGRKRTMSETFGAGGWEMNFFDQKMIGDWEYALGVNFMNQHLSYMTIMGARKRDHPLSFSYHEPWWHAYSLLGSYFARLSVALSLGEQQNTILVLEPTTTAWMYYSPTESNPRLEGVGRDFQDFVNHLESRQIEYDLGSEFILKNQAKVSKKGLRVGRRTYSLVVLPPGLENLRKETVALFEDYLRSGGKILSWVEMPAFVDGRESADPAQLAEAYADGWKQADGGSGWEMLASLSPPELDFSETDMIGGLLFHHRRVLKDAEIVFLVNTSPDENSTGRFTFSGNGSAPYRSCEMWDAFTGEVKPYPSRFADGKLSIDFDLPAGGSLLLCLRPDDSGYTAVPKQTGEAIEGGSRLSVRLLSPNVLTLDYCDLTLGTETEKDLYFYEAQRKAFQHHGLDRNPWDSAVQYKSNIIDKDSFPDGSGFKADFWFEAADAVALDRLKCVVERPALFKVYCNGIAIEALEGEWWLDKVFGVFDIGGAARPGKNRITLEAKAFTIHTELESVYILGKFDLEGGDRGFRLVPSADKALGSWKAQGMPFYAHGVSYEKDFVIPAPGEKDRFKVLLGEFSGAVAEVMVNGESAGFIAFNPKELDITKVLKQGRNRVSVVVYGTLKNTLGPHHNNPAPGTAWPSDFQRGAEGGYPPGKNYSLLDYGLMEDFLLVHWK